MTAQGSPFTVLRRAILGGNLGAVDLALIDVTYIDLEDALEILMLLEKANDPRFFPWAERWAHRVSAGEHERLASLLEQLPATSAVEELRARARRVRQTAPATRLAVEGRGGRRA